MKKKGLQPESTRTPRGTNTQTLSNSELDSPRLQTHGRRSEENRDLLYLNIVLHRPSADDSWAGFLSFIVHFCRATHATWIPPVNHRRAMNGGFLRFSGTSPTGAGLLERPPQPLLKHTQLCVQGKR